VIPVACYITNVTETYRNAADALGPAVRVQGDSERHSFARRKARDHGIDFPAIKFG
jgi:hypothetical protein